MRAMSEEKRKNCPRCGEDIQSLLYIIKEKTVQELLPDGKYYETATYREEDDYYLCPKCRGALFGTEEQALAFLQG